MAQAFQIGLLGQGEGRSPAAAREQGTPSRCCAEIVLSVCGSLANAAATAAAIRSSTAWSMAARCSGTNRAASPASGSRADWCRQLGGGSGVVPFAGEEPGGRCAAPGRGGAGCAPASTACHAAV
jgi:hypothetical protein